MSTTTNAKTGYFERKHHIWSIDNFDDGWIHSIHKRFFVLVPAHPKASKTGYIKRSLAVWEHYHGPVPDGFVIHHKNQDRLDDRIENLECLTKKDHDEHHRLIQRKGFYRNCIFCGDEFHIARWRLKDGRPGIVCKKGICRARAVWRNHKKTIMSICEYCGNKYEKITKKIAINRTCCSRSCAISLSWKKRKSI